MLGVGGWKTIVGVTFGAFAATLPQMKGAIDPEVYKWLMIFSGFTGIVLTGLGIAHKVEKAAAQISQAGISAGDAAGHMHMGLVAMLAALSLIACISIAGCAKLAPPSTNIDAEKGPICDRVEYIDSLICAQLRAHDIANAEDARDLILDLNDISLILEFYTTDQLAAYLNKWDDILSGGGVTYALYLSGLIKDVDKVARVVTILKRRFGYLLSVDEVVRPSDLRLLRLLNMRIREASGIEISSS